jgi:glycolate oxidase iron-sulfur subunit
MTIVNYNLIGVLPNADILSQCIHCGMCLSTCPTYEITKLETSSPRGRIKMIKSVARGEMNMTKTFADEMNFCLDCQACETACPAGVKYGSMVEAARVEVDKAKLYGSFLRRFIKKVFLKYILTSKRRLRFAARLLYLYQNRGIQLLLHKSGIFKLILRRLSEIDKMSPGISKEFSESIIPEFTPAKGDEKYKTAFHIGCLMDVMFADINRDTVDVLSSMNCSVHTPKNQFCCGSLPAHNGDFETAKRLMKKNIDTFIPNKYDYLISNTAGCSAFMKEYGDKLKDDPEYKEKAIAFSSKVKDIIEFIEENISVIRLKPLNEVVTYHDACHHVHSQNIFSQPRTVLSAIPDLKLVPLEESTWCCGSAGIYNIDRYKDSMIILERKMNNIRNTNAGKVITGNPGCISQIRYGAKKFGLNVEVIHPVSFLKKVLGM